MGDATKPDAQWLLIVSTKSRALFQYLSRSFKDVPTVEVILDRREGERRGRSAGPAAERRRGERRSTTGQRERYPLLGYVLVRRNGAAPNGRVTDAAKSGRDGEGILSWPPGGSRRR
jgi:hypothetical protein